MKAQHTYKHIDRSESLEKFVDQRLREVERFLLKQGMAQIVYGKQKGLFTIEVTLSSKEKYFKSTEEGVEIYAAVSEALNKLEKQILKTRKINTNHKKYDLSKRGKLDRVNERFEHQMAKWKKAA